MCQKNKIKHPNFAKHFANVLYFIRNRSRSMAIGPWMEKWFEKN